MKYKYRKIFTSIIIFFIIIFIALSSYCSESQYSFYYNENNVIAYTKLNRVRLSLTNGQTIADTYATANSSVNFSTITCPIEVVLLLDCSGSMLGNKMSTTLNSAQALVDKMFNDSEVSELHVGLAVFSSTGTSEIISNFTSDYDEITSAILNINPVYGGTVIGEGMERCEEIFKERDSIRSADTKKYLIMLTDGIDALPSYSLQEQEKLYNDDVNLFTLLIDMESSTALPNGTYGNIVYPNVETGDIENIFYEIFDQIKSESVSIDFNEGEIKNFSGGFILNNNVYIILDEELKQSCFLELEYSINIRSSKNISYMRLLDHINDNNLSYSANAKMLSDSSQKNSDFNWILDNTDNVTSLFSSGGNTYKIETQAYNGNYVISRGQSFEAKIYLSRMLSTSSDSDYGSELLINLIDENDNEIEIPLTGSQIYVIPPFGNNTSISEYIKPIIIALSILLFMIILIAIILKNTKKRIFKIYTPPCSKKHNVVYFFMHSLILILAYQQSLL